MSRFARILKQDKVFLDGSMGTMLQQRGLKLGELPELLNLTRPELVEEVHRGYIRAGAEIIYTNTFGLNARKLRGSGHTVEEVLQAAVSIAKRAASGSGALVALDLGPIGELLYPSGSLRFDEAYELFKELALEGERAGVDLVAAETLTDLGEARAALLAVKENTALPILVTMSFDESGRSFQGVLPESMAQVLTGLGADAIGVNCSLGPRQLVPIVEKIAQNTTLPLAVKANAGLPRPDGSGYDLSAEEFAAAMQGFAALGVKLYGGCCGTEPSFISAMKKALDGEIPAIRELQPPLLLCSPSRALCLCGHAHVIGERINPTGRKPMQQALKKGDVGYILSLAIEQQQAGAEILDINVGLPGLHEPATMKKVVEELQGVSDLPLQIDSSDPEAIEAGLRAFHGLGIVNSVNGKAESLQAILPLAKKYGACVLGLTLDEGGIPKDAEGRIAIAERILSAAIAAGIPKEKVFIDCLTLTVSAQPEQATETLKALSFVRRELGLQTVLGVSNISFGLPAREIVNQNFLAMAMQAGLTLPILNPGVRSMVDAVSAYNLLAGGDKRAERYIARVSGRSQERAAPPLSQAISPGGLIAAVEAGLKEECARQAKGLLEELPPLEIVETALIPALDIVGQKYERGKLFLPQLIAAASAAEGAFAEIRRALSKSGETRLSKGKILLATVKGDIHDIGKNIVKVVLENYGFEVFDLGRDVEPSLVVETAMREKIALIGLSALMTTTLPSMEATIRALKESGHPCKTMVGGAVLTADYAREIGADFYARDAKQSADIARRFFQGAEAGA
ncbi:MAG: homocysteine S-methyltransferase family protein [Christensenellaceae bacterium]|jgi:5-methyltetrahydrofolate--homocysteine methyltransferase|nr:homocysteine S-methyltransferase family protein [Christensenellaceae bacterium]